MTKQQKIREDIWQILRASGLHIKEADEALERIWTTLDSQGVVLKVEGIQDMATTASQGEILGAVSEDELLISSEKTLHVFKFFKKGGWSATERLIEEG